MQKINTKRLVQVDTFYGILSIQIQRVKPMELAHNVDLMDHDDVRRLCSNPILFISIRSIPFVW